MSKQIEKKYVGEEKWSVEHLTLGQNQNHKFTNNIIVTITSEISNKTLKKQLWLTPSVKLTLSIISNISNFLKKYKHVINFTS